MIELVCMKVYVAHSTSFDYKNELYQPLKDLRLDGVEFIFPHDESTEPTNSKERMKEYDLVLAEVSYPSTGMGIELGWADMLGIPIVCIHKEGTKVSEAVKGVCREMELYIDTDELKRAIESLIASYR